MLYGWIEVGLSNNTLFRHENDQDIIIRTIYNNKIILGNTNGVNADAAMYIQGNNVGIYKVPDSNVSLDVNGLTVLQRAQVGHSNMPTEVVVNGQIILKDAQKDFSTDMEMRIANSNNIYTMQYNDIERIRVTDGNGISMNDNVYVTNDVYATAFQITSDIRFKTNVTDTNKEEDVTVVKGVVVKDYDMNGKRRKGFIAQNIADLYPNAVMSRKWQGEDIKTIDANQILALNTSVLQNLIERVEKLESIFKCK